MGFDEIGHSHDDLAFGYTLKTTKKGYSEIPSDKSQGCCSL
jgi:hypothetical protein